MSKKCTPLWREAHLQVKKLKTPSVRSTFGSWDVEKVHAVVARSTFRSQNVQNTSALEHLWKLRCSKSVRRCGGKHISKSKCTKHYMIAPLLDVQMSFRVAGARDCAPCQKWAKRQGFVNDGRCGTFEDDLERCISRGRHNTRDMFIRDVGRSGRRFPERGCILAHEIFRFGKMILRDRYSTSYDLASLFRGRRNTLDRRSGKKHKTHWYEAVSSALNFSCFEGGLAELLRFWCCQVQDLRKPRRIASFWMLSRSQIGEVSQNCRVFKLTDKNRQTVRQTDRQTDS